VALDLANKSELAVAGNGNGLAAEQIESLELGFRSALGYVDPRYVAGDPAAWASDFATPSTARRFASTAERATSSSKSG